MVHRGVGRWFGKGGLYRSIGKGSMISVYKIEPSYVTIRKHRGAPAPGAPMVPTPMVHKHVRAIGLYDTVRIAEVAVSFNFTHTRIANYCIPALVQPF